jgi:hypothetical protein
MVVEWRELMLKLEGITLTKEEDIVTWKLEPSGKYTTRSMYRLITFGGAIDLRMVVIWNAKMPLKVQIFLWMAWHDGIQTAQQPRRRNWDGSKFCKFCGKEEFVGHLLFQCSMGVV